MTMVKETPPPLPVRNRTAAGERPRDGVSPMLTRLAAERASGVLVRERGTLHLAEGEVVHAESPCAPDLGVLLAAHGTLDAETWQEAVARADERRPVGRLLVAAGHLTEAELELCHLGALYDAAYFALAPSSTPGRFRYGTAHRPGTARPVPVAALEQAALRGREVLHRVLPDARTDSAPLIRADPAGTPSLTHRQRAVLERVDGVRTATDIARDLGRRAFPVLVDVRRLAAAGLVLPAPAPGPPVPGPAPGPPAPGPPPDPGDATVVPGDPLPYVTDPHITLLKRLRDALEAL
ncbi:transcriptional regulator [Streptomyces sp. NPDC046831]|uniref:transcriptional regulator n=1 Tax=Streptomyces sp. NPDC046831 TaxID=3154805 RepID=UPI0033DD15A8